MATIFEQVKQEMEIRMPDRTFKVQKVEKANVSYTGIMLDMGVGNPCPVFMIPDDMTAAEIPNFCDGIQYQIDHMKNPPIKCSDVLGNWEIAKTKLFVRAVNAENSKAILAETPHRLIGDIALVPYVEVSENACSVAKSKLCASWGVLPDAIMDIALENAATFKPMKCQSLCGILTELGVNSEILNPNEPYVISNKEMVYGASAIFYNGVLDAIADMIFDGDFWILPSSTEEVLVMKAENADGEQYYQMVKNINANTVSIDERLSDRPLYYSTTLKELYQYNPATGKIEKV